MKDFEAFVADKLIDYGDKFNDSKLSKQFIPFWEKGPMVRVKVQFSYGEARWGWVGVTTGWTPTFLLMRNINSRSSSDTLTDDDKIIDWRNKK